MLNYYSKTLNKIHPKDKRAFGSFNLGKEFAKITGFLKGMQFLTWFVGIATLIAGVFAIGNILLITVKERTKEIGVRRALGATPFEIKRQIVVEAVFLTIVAGTIWNYNRRLDFNFTRSFLWTRRRRRYSKRIRIYISSVYSINYSSGFRNFNRLNTSI